MLTQTFSIGQNATLKSYLWEDSEELAVTKRPAVLVLPGGAYMMCSDREAEPIALAYMAEGFNAFVLRYTTCKDFAPAFAEARQALAMIRANAEPWHIAPDKVAVCGFSAGGHLACALGTMAAEKPSAMVLGYAAVVGEDWRKLTDKIPDLVCEVNDDTAPAFLFACRDDNVVPIHNSIALMDAFDKHNIPFETHLYSKGGHGFSLAKRHTFSGDTPDVTPRAESWFAQSVSWLKETIGDVEVAEKSKLPTDLAPAIYRPILELTANKATNEVLLKYSPAFGSEQLLAMAGSAVVADVVIPLRLTDEQIAALANELQNALNAEA